MDLFDDSKEGYTGEGRGCWEPKGYYFFRRMFHVSTGFIVIGCALARYDTLRTGAVVAGCALLASIVSFVGIIVTAPTKKKHRNGDQPPGTGSQQKRWRL